MKYITQSMPSTTWVAFNRSRICSTSPATFILTLTSLIGQHKYDQWMVPISYGLTILRWVGALDWSASSSDFIAASTPPARCGTPAAVRPISTPESAPSNVSSLHSPRWPMRNTLPATFERPEPSEMLYFSSAILRNLSASCPGGISTAVKTGEYSAG